MQNKRKWGDGLPSLRKGADPKETAELLLKFAENTQALKGIKAEQYQLEGAWFLATTPFALLADEMGLGKTPQAIFAADLLKLKRIIVICPAVARINWAREIDKFSPNPRHVVPVLEWEKDWPKVTDDSSVILSYDMATKNIDQINKLDGKFGAIIIDECHFVKSVDAKRTSAIYGNKGLVRKAERVWCLSGTPCPNHYGELWPMLFTFGRTKKPYNKFIEDYCTTYRMQYTTRISGNQVAKVPEIQEMLRPIMLRRLKEDVLAQLPKLRHEGIVLPLSPFSLEEMPTLQKWFTPYDNTQELKDHVKAQRKLMQDTLVMDTYITSTEASEVLQYSEPGLATMRLFLAAQKIGSFCELISQELDANAYEKIVIFAVHRDVIEAVRRKLERFGATTLNGSTNAANRQKRLDEFRKKKGPRVFIANIQACGTAISLTCAHEIAFIESDFTPANMAQAIARCHRMGQKNPVRVRYFSADDRLDERINDILHRKTNQILRLFDESEYLSRYSGENKKSEDKKIIGKDFIENILEKDLTGQNLPGNNVDTEIFVKKDFKSLDVEKVLSIETEELEKLI